MMCNTIRLAVWLHAFTIISVVSTHPHRLPHAPILLIDVDNTLYSEDRCGIEAQIRQGIYRFCNTLGVAQEQADEWHHKYGSTVEGLRRHCTNDADVLKDFYEQVYADIDLSGLTRDDSATSTTTGYSPQSASTRRLANVLNCIPYPMYLTSNSPKYHVRRVLRALGLAHIPWAGIVTPDTFLPLTYPTKAGQPDLFYQTILQKHPVSSCILLDDSKLNLLRARELLGMSGIYVSPLSNTTIDTAISMALGHVSDDYVFSTVQYLVSKNLVDAKSIHGPTWDKMRDHVVNNAIGGVITIADVGAGLLNMLQLLIMGDGEQKKSLLIDGTIQKVNYYAFESNLALYSSCKDRLERLGFTEVHDHVTTTDGDQVLFIHGQLNISLYLFMCDFATVRKMDDHLPPPQLIVGCCFADLMEPHHLIQSLQIFLQVWKRVYHNEILLYFPITFAGTTQFIPPSPFGPFRMPSDTLAFRSYSEALSKEHGHNLEPNKLVSAVQSYGGRLIHRGPSNWSICPKQNTYLWNTMLYFFGTVSAPALMKEQWDSVGWIQRSKQAKAKIEVSNVDLLFSFPTMENDETASTKAYSRDPKAEGQNNLVISEIEFTAPYKVGIATRTVDTKDNMHLGPNQVEIESITSLISSGTELKIFKGLFDDAALDLTIGSMTDQRMAYPLAYGYSLVGRVTRCGPNVADCDMLMGQLVFSFAPHSTHVICDRDSILLVPDGISAEDAIFLPSVETALSLVHDANVRVGEKVAIYGQGLIGLLVTAILNRDKQMLSTGEFGTISVFDTIPNRLAAASFMGASEALMPTSVANTGPFDVSIEISGNYKALQSAIDHTRNGGRVIVGSWYGNTDVTLKLGIDFHRSHKTIKTSQVSKIPAELTSLWSKDRRFALAWEFVKFLQPSRLLTQTTSFLQVQDVYESLDKGNDNAVAFKYK